MKKNDQLDNFQLFFKRSDSYEWTLICLCHFASVVPLFSLVFFSRARSLSLSPLPYPFFYSFISAITIDTLEMKHKGWWVVGVVPFCLIHSFLFSLLHFLSLSFSLALSLSVSFFNFVLASKDMRRSIYSVLLRTIVVCYYYCLLLMMILIVLCLISRKGI